MLNFQDRYSIIRSPGMQNRITGIITNFALYLVNGGSPGTLADGTTPVDAGHALQWAKETLLSPENVADKASWYVLNQQDFFGADTQGWTAGSSIADATLQGIIETAVKNHFIAPASP